MSLDKNTAIKQLGTNSNVANQESLVKKLSGPRINKAIKHTIPGGSNLTELVSKETLPDTNTKLPQWEIQGKRWLADRISEVLAMDHVVAVKVTKEGITAMLDSEQSFSSESEDWLPQIIFTPNKPTGF